MNRRGFLQSCLAMAAAPAIVRAESIMQIWTPPSDVLRCFWPALELGFDKASFIGSAYIFNNGSGAWERQVIGITPDQPRRAPTLRLDSKSGLGVESGGTIALRQVEPIGNNLTPFAKNGAVLNALAGSRIVFSQLNSYATAISIIK